MPAVWPWNNTLLRVLQCARRPTRPAQEYFIKTDGLPDSTVGVLAIKQASPRSDARLFKERGERGRRRDRQRRTTVGESARARARRQSSAARMRGVPVQRLVRETIDGGAARNCIGTAAASA
jgi:hypothetical protein